MTPIQRAAQLYRVVIGVSRLYFMDSSKDTRPYSFGKFPDVRNIRQLQSTFADALCSTKFAVRELPSKACSICGV